MVKGNSGKNLSFTAYAGAFTTPTTFSPSGSWEEMAFIITAGSTEEGYSYQRIALSQVTDSTLSPYYIKWMKCTDLTLMCGIGNEPTTVADFEKICPPPGYSYRGPATVEKIYGRTVVWNQLQQIPPTDLSKTENGVTITDNRDGSYTVSTDANGATATVDLFLTSFLVVSGHNYIIRGCPSGGGASSYRLRTGNGRIVATDNGSGVLKDALTSGSEVLGIRIISGAIITTPVVFWPQCIDLTLATLTDITTPGQFTALYHLPHYPYDAGSLQSLAPEAIESRGVNQWDEEWEQGDILSTNGQNNSGTNNWRTKNYIPVFPETEYYITGVGISSELSLRGRYYDYQKNYIGYSDFDGRDLATSRVFKTPTNAYYVRFAPGVASIPAGTRLCVNISNPAINGQYFPFRGSHAGINLNNFPYGMNNVGDVYDEKTPKKDVRRLGKINLGTPNWQADTQGGLRIFKTYIQDAIAPDSYHLANIKCAKYQTSTMGNLTQVDGSISGSYVSDAYKCQIRIYDSAHQSSDATAFRNAMDGVYLVYELAEPVETAINEDMTYLVQQGGTEEVTPITAPFKADIRYSRDI